ncbi:MAG: hypothetical protein WCD11_21310 [Solirubrobacteraceae bacterium]
MDAFLSVASKREVRDYAGRPIPADAEQRILEDADAVAALLDLEDGERPITVLTFGYPVRTRDPERRTAIEWLERADRKPFDDVVQRL